MLLHFVSVESINTVVNQMPREETYYTNVQHTTACLYVHIIYICKVINMKC